MRFWWLSFLLTTSCGEGSDPKEIPATIEQVSHKITYDSVARLGPHHAISSIQQSDTRDGEEAHSSMESIDIAWNSWDSFHFQRALDGEATFEVIVHEGTFVSRNGHGPWTGELDGEPARLDVYTAWNAWDEALGMFKDRIQYEDLGSSTVDGRDTRRFRVSLQAEPEQKKRKKRRRVMQPAKLEGEVHLDAATAVRLSADVTAVATQGTVKRTIQLQIRRSRIGQSQPIEAPAVQLGTPGDLLKKIPSRRSGRGPDPTKLR
jgi:hypothetical protein